MRLLSLLPLLAACHPDVRYTTHAFIAPGTCGQGPYDVHLRADGRTGSEGVEVWACTPRRISGHVEMLADGMALRDVPFGDGADNARCVSGGPVVATAAGDGPAHTASSAGGAPGTRGAEPVLVAQAFDDHGALIPDDACKPYGLDGEYLMNGTMTPMKPGGDIDVRIWSDAPNDLEGVVFLVRHAISTHTRAEEEKEWATLEVQPAAAREKQPDHGAPPAPLAEERPGSSSASARWVPGYWVWTGSQWGWIAGFWRDDGVAMPVPRVELPGAPPAGAAVWIGGVWQLRAGAWVWLGGRWRR